MSATRSRFSLSLILLLALAPVGRAQPAEAPPPVSEARRPQGNEELRYWLENMIVFHHFSVAEVCSATGCPLKR